MSGTLKKKSQKQSEALLDRAERVIPGGVNSPVRAFKHVGGKPLFIERGEGPYIIDVDGNRFVDYVGSWGPLILGHRHPVILDAIRSAMERGTSFGAPTDLEVEFAELLCELLPGIEMIRFVNSGTEATMSAIRLARAFTGRELLLKFNGCYHGHADSLLIQAGSGVATLGIAGSKGVPEDVAKRSVSVEFNDLPLLKRTVEDLGAHRFAAVIVEPVPGNMGLVLPEPGYLEGLREFCTEKGIVLIIDEVMTGFRVGLTGASGRFGVTPDLATYGKVIGGGLPVGAFGGKREIMSMLAPVGPVYQAGTLSGNPLAMSAGLAAIRYLIANNPYEKLEKAGKGFAQALKSAAKKRGVALQTDSCGSMIGMFFSAEPVKNYSEAAKSNRELFNSFFWEMLDRGHYFAPSAFEAGFLSVLHDDAVLSSTLAAAAEVFEELGK